MTKEQELKQVELDMLEDLIHSDGWSVVKRIFKDHAIYMVKESHLALEKHEDRKAGELLARSKEPQCLINKVRGRVDELRQTKEE